MSDETTPDDLPTEEANRTLDAWVMPEPIFRSTEGHTPKQSKASPSAEEVDTLETDVEEGSPQAAVVDTPSQDIAVETLKKKGGCFRSLLFIVGSIALFVAAIVIALIYFLFYARPVDTGTF